MCFESRRREQEGAGGVSNTRANPYHMHFSNTNNGTICLLPDGLREGVAVGYADGDCDGYSEGVFDGYIIEC